MLDNQRPSLPTVLPSEGRTGPACARWSRWWAGGRRRPGPRCNPGTTSSSLEAPAERLLGVVRTHWSIENSLHSLDVTFGEDHYVSARTTLAGNMAALRQVSHNRERKSLKVGIQGKRLPGWKEDYLLKVLRS